LEQENKGELLNWRKLIKRTEYTLQHLIQIIILLTSLIAGVKGTIAVLQDESGAKEVIDDLYQVSQPSMKELENGSQDKEN
jgi:hypothetical protein